MVDDEPSIVKAVRAYLEKEGYAVRTAADGAVAVAVARDYRPDLVVLDIMLPGMDGLEVLRQLRRESEVYVLFLTARSEETDRVVDVHLGWLRSGRLSTATSSPGSPACLRRARDVAAVFDQLV